MKLNYSFLAAMALGTGVLGLVSFGIADEMGGMDMGGAKAPSTQPAGAVDAGNKACPVSGEEIGDSKLTEVYDGKIYHFCCEGCPAKFKKDPEKYIKAMAADPAKYGVKAGS